MKFFVTLFQMFRLLIQLALFAIIGFVIYILAVVYSPDQTYFSGWQARYVPYAFVAIPLAMFIFIFFTNVSLKDEQRAQGRIKMQIKVFCLVAGITMLHLIPYGIYQIQLEKNVRTEFTAVWGPDWESRVQKPENGPWMDRMYNYWYGVFGLNYDKESYDFINDTEYLRIGDDSFRYNAYVPKGTGPFPVIINVHGGGWAGGDKTQEINYRMEYMAAAGYVVFNINYGAVAELNINRQYNMTEICSNIATFTDWMAVNATGPTYKARLDQTFIMGLSAGGHLSALMAMARNTVCAWNPVVRLIGGIHYYPPVNFFNCNPQLVDALYTWGVINASVQSNPALWAIYSPITYVLPGAGWADQVPNLVFQGEMDSVVFVQEVRDFALKCDQFGLKSVYVEIPKAEHVFEGNPNFCASQMTLWAMERFCQLVISEL